MMSPAVHQPPDDPDCGGSGSGRRIAVVTLVGVLTLSGSGVALADGYPDQGIRIWATGSVAPGSVISVFAECGIDRRGLPIRDARVSGPDGMFAKLVPGEVATGPLTGAVVVPESYPQATVVLTLHCLGKGKATTTVRMGPQAAALGLGSPPLQVTGPQPTAAVEPDQVPVKEGLILAGVGAIGAGGALKWRRMRRKR